MGSKYIEVPDVVDVSDEGSPPSMSELEKGSAKAGDSAHNGTEAFRAV